MDGIKTDKSRDELLALMGSSQQELAIDNIDNRYFRLRIAFIIYMNFGADEDYQTFSDLMHEFIGLLTASLMTDRSYSGANDSLFAGIIYRLDRQMSKTLAKPLNLSFEGLRFTLTINPILFFMYYESPKQMLAGIRQICYHIIFNHMTDYDWAFQETEDAKVMSVAMETEINQYIQDLPSHAVSLPGLRKKLDVRLQEKKGTLYYYQEMKKIANDPSHPSHNRTLSTFEKMKGSGQMDDLYSQLAGNFDEDKLSDLRIDSAEQLNDEMKKNFSMQQVIPQGKNNDLHRKIINGLVRKAYDDLTDEMREHLSGQLSEKVKPMNKSRAINWKDIIQRGEGATPVPYRLSKNRMNRRQPFRIDLPGRVLDTATTLIVFVDTSASQNEEALAYSLGELANIQKTLGNQVWLVQVDTKVVKAERLTHQTLSQFSFEGRGGTSFAPAFEWLHDHGFNDHNSVAVYFTDGYGDDGFDRYGYHNMYWILTQADPQEENPLSTESYGKILYLRQSEAYNNQLMQNRLRQTHD
ncbi:VWA-like domain-containing protein [Aerococcus sp. UMB10185]|uniref:vWA domain-containing protein n=1 Tax=unclassified Aerococcus TaxID=2618060 RepID=UPI0008A23173|nr:MULTISPECIES: VWA-like domain-containing protein [unclassified Aerococcus]MDK6232681.1 VWA-like domain-containing protein [Aerococcus sp. UMB10185]MDK6855029.1 VWA-like domain-containing protein [Aerococcus sp. UMB7533]MDK8501705.1 VWA-like domain-containing protein [Aerococcus sp. UMB1112A]OFN02785.1 hypothetical protein HMPREF2626_02420 [Aerococcus sp. HMSC062A02]OHO45546.1 hypothetical protein HMPREF2705_04380 [Aerococcus sp. HMSC035B07]